MKKTKINSWLHEFLRTFAGRGIIVKICAGIIIFIVVIAILAPLLTPYSPTEMSLTEKLQQASNEHLLGTDHLGRDLLTRLLYGSRISLTTSVLSCVIASVIGMLLGMVAGYYKGMVSQIIMRITDAQLSIPPLILTIVLASLFEGGVKGVSIVIGISLLPTYICVIYSLVLSLKESDYVVAAKLLGKSSWGIVVKHLIPNCIPSLIVLFTMNLGTAIMLEASMSFLGVGISAPTPAWGSMVSEGYNYLIMYPSLALLPGFCVLLTVVAFNVVGDGLRDALDPRLRGKL